MNLPKAYHLPNEIWRVVFVLATIPTQVCDYALDYSPFQDPQEREESPAFLESGLARLKTCLALIRVCRSWKSIAEEILYQDVRILNPQGVQGLVDGLERSAAQGETGALGHHVRRIELPIKQAKFTPRPSSTQFSSNLFSPHRLFDFYGRYHSPLPQPNLSSIPLGRNLFNRLLECCPRLEILVRRPCLCLDADQIHFWGSLICAPSIAAHPILPTLKRLEWHESDLDIRFYSNGNGKRLADIIRSASNLRYLFVSSDRPDVLSRLKIGTSVETLRLSRSHPRSRDLKDMRPEETTGRTQLANLIIPMSMRSAVLSFLSVTGWQLRVLELSFAPQLVISPNQMYRLLSRCPNLEELVYHLGAPELSPLDNFQHASLKSVRIRINSDEYYPYKHVVRSQFEVLAGPSFPALEHIILHDVLRSFTRRDSSRDLLQLMTERGCPVEYEDGSLVPPRC